MNMSHDWSVGMARQCAGSRWGQTGQRSRDNKLMYVITKSTH